MLIGGFWTIPDNPPTNPDCFIIPSYALRDRSLPTLPTRTQIELACQWWSRFPQAKLIMSTGDNQGLGIPNARVMAQYARALGIPAESMIEEDRSLNTQQNLRYSLDIVRAERCVQPTLVTLDLYTRRAVATAHKQGWPPFHWLSVFSPGQSAYGLKALQTHSRLTILLYEMAATVYSKVARWS
jgi:uncharacterized SAM-binding protein YcdF (DUF218 family)